MADRTTPRKLGAKRLQHGAPKGLLARLALPKEPLAAHRIISGGISTVVIFKIAADFDIETAAVCRWAGIDRSTFKRRDQSTEKRLSVGQGAAVYGMARAMDAALEMFDGDKQKALIWLKAPARALGGQAPVELLSTPAGADAVFDLITRIEHGVVS